MWMERFAVMQRTSNEITPGKSLGVFQLNGEGIHSMPAFSFEKLSPPRRGPIAPIVKKQRGLVVQILDRFVEARVKRDEKREVDRAKPKT